MRHFMPGIVGRAVVVIEPGRPIGELDRMRLAEQDHSRNIELAHYRAVFPGDVVCKQVRTGRVGSPFTSNRSLAA